jgi:hypothetical protein
MADTRQRVDRAIAALSEKQKAALLDINIGPVTPGSAPDPENDARYLRGIVEDQLRELDARETADLAELAGRLDRLEHFVRNGLVDGIAETIVDTCQQQLRASGFMQHRGTWDEDLAYHKGDCVITDGGTWLAITDTAKGVKPGKGLEWRLIARGDVGSGKRSP